jgi:hypothetical protein
MVKIIIFPLKKEHLQSAQEIYNYLKSKNKFELTIDTDFELDDKPREPRELNPRLNRHLTKNVVCTAGAKLDVKSLDIWLKNLNNKN